MKRVMLVAVGMIFICACARNHQLGPTDLTYVAHVSMTETSPTTFHITGSVTNPTQTMIRLHLFGACGSVGFRLYPEVVKATKPIFKYDPICAGPEDLVDRGVMLRPGEVYTLGETFRPSMNIPGGNYRVAVTFYESHIPTEVPAGSVVIP